MTKQELIKRAQYIFNAFWGYEGTGSINGDCAIGKDIEDIATSEDINALIIESINDFDDYEEDKETYKELELIVKKMKEMEEGK